ncbi:hypothetical protein ACQ4PT_050670 [Festuca glaucescens]
MAMEIWNINLYYEDENKKHKVLEASMDRTNISFYDLVNLIEGVGFSGIDYLYYRKKYPRGRGHLVHIDNDTHVRKMITEHNKEKRVQLYVYKERVNIDVAPSEPQGEDDGPITSFEEEDAFPEGATQTRTGKLQTMVRKSKRLNVVQSRAQYANGDFANSEQSRSSRELLETHELEDNEDHLTERDDNLDNMTGDGKAVDKRGAHSLPAVWNMPDGARIVVKCNNLGQPIGTKADLADLEKLIHNEPELAQSDHGKVAWKGDALHTILGEEKPGQVHGMGLLLVPNQVYGPLPRYLKNINMTTTNGSSHAGESDVMEEIAKLKRRIEEQDQRIEEQDQIIEGFRNQDEANFRQGNDESQPEVPQNRRKRVHASGPEQVRLVSRPKDTIKIEKFSG